ncbi:MAG: ABC transporter permease [Bacilli bacterium]|nr:ABC transporter permease [Bacilli bacterium]
MKRKPEALNAAKVREPITDADFVFVERKGSIHDEKMKTKPTTFFKDAMKRFLKNRSSVVASVILFTLIAMAIIVPVANKNNIDRPAELVMHYLPPKWFDVNDAHFMDGTRVVNDEALDPETGKLGASSTYRESAIVGEITKTSTFTDDTNDSVLNYGKGGDLSIQAVNLGQVTGIYSASYPVDFSRKLSYTVTFDIEEMEAKNNACPTYFVGYCFDYEGDEQVVPLVKTGEYQATLTVDDAASAFRASDFYQGLEADAQTALEADFKPALIVGMEAWDEDGDAALTLNMLYIHSVAYTLEGEDADHPEDVNCVAWADATKAFKAYDDGSETCYTPYGNSSKLGLHNSEVVFGSFVYDCYEGAFGTAIRTFSEADIEEYINKGYMTLDQEAINALPAGKGQAIPEDFDGFHLTELGEKMCPLRKLVSYDIIRGRYSGTTLYGECSYYRYYYDKGIIATCEMPRYFFGTNAQGKDFFKLVFAGLLSSLGIGLMSAAINIFVGLIWGAVSGYFGGVTDLVMERVTEILGGMPWVVLMTLVILLMGSNSWTFLLALCLTGWMGTAHLTRSQFYRYKGREYVLASRTLGASDFRLIFRHILPNAIGTIITSSVLMIPSVIFTEANIAYLLPNLYQSSTQSFGLALQAAQSDIAQYPYLIVSSSIIMMLIMISFNLFGNGLRDAFNPSLKGTDE